MNIDIIQVIVSFFESFFILSISNEFAYHKNKKSLLGLFPWVVITFICVQLFGMFLTDSNYTIFLNFLIVSIIIFFAFKGDTVRPFFGQIFVNIIGIISNLVGAIAYIIFFTNGQNINLSTNLKAIIFIVCIEMFFLILTYKYRAKIAFKFNKTLKNKYILFAFTLFYQIIMIISVIIMIIVQYKSKKNNFLNVSFLFIILILVMVLFMVRFAKMYVEYYEARTILEELAMKNDELRKIKHDYASQLSFLYALYQLNKIDKLGEMMKQIIESNDNTSGTIEIYNTKNPVFISALKVGTKAGIHVVVDDKVDIEMLDIKANDLAKIVFNIVNNAVMALSETSSPLIKIYTAEDKNSIYVTIENNGSQIPKEILNNIFIKGFTTKNESREDHGYGLAIVKELIEKYNGKISVKSEAARTEFNMIFAKKTTNMEELTK